MEPITVVATTTPDYFGETHVLKKIAESFVTDLLVFHEGVTVEFTHRKVAYSDSEQRLPGIRYTIGMIAAEPVSDQLKQVAQQLVPRITVEVEFTQDGPTHDILVTEDVMQWHASAALNRSSQDIFDGSRLARSHSYRIPGASNDDDYYTSEPDYESMDSDRAFDW